MYIFGTLIKIIDDIPNQFWWKNLLAFDSSPILSLSVISLWQMILLLCRSHKVSSVKPNLFWLPKIWYKRHQINLSSTLKRQMWDLQASYSVFLFVNWDLILHDLRRLSYPDLHVWKNIWNIFLQLRYRQKTGKNVLCVFEKHVYKTIHILTKSYKHRSVKTHLNTFKHNSFLELLSCQDCSGPASIHVMETAFLLICM